MDTRNLQNQHLVQEFIRIWYAPHIEEDLKVCLTEKHVQVLCFDGTEKPISFQALQRTQLFTNGILRLGERLMSKENYEYHSSELQDELQAHLQNDMYCSGEWKRIREALHHTGTVWVRGEET